MRKILSLSAIVLSFVLSTAHAQGYIDCATVVNNGEFPTLEYSVAKNGYFYAVFQVSHTFDPSYLLPVINGETYDYPSFDDDAYLAIFDPNCNQLLGTYIGGNDYDGLYGMEVDAAGNVYVTGETASTDFYTTDGTSVTPGNYVTFLRKYAVDGTLIYSTILDSGSYGSSILLDGTDVILYAGGYGVDFPTTNGTTPSGNTDAAIVKYDATGNIIFSTIYGGSGSDSPQSAYLLNGDFYLTGTTLSADFPTTDGTTYTGTRDVFFMRIDGAGNVVFSTMFGGNDLDQTAYLTSDGTDFYIAGITGSTNFLTTDGSTYAGGSRDIYYRKYDAAGNMLYSKLFGGSGYDGVTSLTSVNGLVYLTGEASEGFPVVNGVDFSGGSKDIVLMNFDAVGNILYSTLYGGASFEDHEGAYVNPAGEIYLYLVGDGSPTTDGTTELGVTYAKFNADGSLCMASTLPSTTASMNNNNVIMEVQGDTIWSVVRVNGGDDDLATTDGSVSEDGSTNMLITKFAFCPATTPIATNILTPASQTVCQNGIVEQIIGEEHIIDGTSFPQIYTGGVIGDQRDIDLVYQWQTSATSGGPWTDIPGPLGQQKNYTPAPTTVDVYYQRLTKTSECCGGMTVSTSDESAVLVTGNIAPTVDAGGTYYTCLSSAINIGGSPAATGGTPAYNYSWNEGAFTAENPSVAPTESTVYTLIVTDANGCMQADQASVVVYSADAGEATSVCDGQGTTIGGSALAGVPVVAAGDTPPANAYSIEYDWTPKNGTLSCTDCPNPFATPGINTDYTLTTIINYPGGGSCQTSDMVQVTVISAPPTTLTIPDTVICLGEEIELGTNPAPISTPSIAAVSQSSGTTVATALNLADGNFTTGGHTNDGTTSNITVDLGSLQTINQIKVAALSGFTNDDALRVEISTDNSTFTEVAYYSTGLSATSLTIINFEEQAVRYVRLASPFSYRDVSISEFSATYDYTYIWTPGTYIITDGANATFDAGNLEMPTLNPVTYTLSATLGTCTFYEQVTVAVIEARAGEDGCGPRYVGEPDRTPNIGETYTWVKITDPSITTGTGNFTGVTNEVQVPVTASIGGQVGYELTTTYTLNGSTGICRDTVIVPDCGDNCDIVTADGSCPSFDNGSPILVGIPPNGDDRANWTYSWTSNMGMVGLDTYTNDTVTLTDNISRRYYITFTSLLDPTYTCVDSIDANSASYSVPIFNATSPVDACAGVAINIGQAATNPGLSYSWSNAANLDDENISYPEATISISTEFTVTVTDNVTGCFVEDRVQVNVAQISAAGQDFTVCDNGTVTIGTNTALPGYTYSWSPTGADWRNGTDENDAMPDVFVATSQEFRLTVTDPSGLCVSRDTVMVTVEPLPPSLTLPDLAYCPSQGADLVLGTNDGTTGGTNLIPGGYTYIWSPGEVSDFSIANPTVNTPLPMGPTTYEIEIRAAGGCNQKATQTIVPTITPPLTSFDKTICLGEATTIGDDANVTGGGLTYSWSPSTDLNNATAINPTFTPSAMGTTTFTVTKSNGSCISTAEVTVTVEDLTAPILTPQTICEGNSVQIGTATDNNLTYEWNPTTDLDNPYIANPTFTGTTSRSYTLTIIDGNGCTAEASTSVTVNPAPTHSITLPDTLICDASATSLVISASVSPAGNYAYNWSPSTYLSSSSVLNPTFFIPAAGTHEYVLEVIDQTMGCSVFDTTMINVSYNEVTAPVLAGNQTFCGGGDAVAFTITTPASSNGTITYQWQSSTSDCTSGFTDLGAASDILTPYDPSFLSTTTHYRVIASTDGGLCADTSNCITVTVNACDWGDLPDTSATTNTLDYQTTAANNGPVHVIIPGLTLGSTIDGEIDGQPSNDALGDDTDEDGLLIFESLDLYPGITFRLPFSYVNTTGNTAHVEAWIDWNADGEFDSGEMVADWDDSSSSFPIFLEVTIPETVATSSLLGLRIRISNQDNMTPYGLINSGEIEDYLIGVGCPQVCVPLQATVIRK